VLVTNKRIVPFYNSCPAKLGHCRTARRYQTLRNILHSGRRLSSVPPSLSAPKFCHPPPSGGHLFFARVTMKRPPFWLKFLVYSSLAALRKLEPKWRKRGASYLSVSQPPSPNSESHLHVELCTIG